MGPSNNLKGIAGLSADGATRSNQTCPGQSTLSGIYSLRLDAITLAPATAIVAAALPGVLTQSGPGTGSVVASPGHAMLLLSKVSG